MGEMCHWVEDADGTWWTDCNNGFTMSNDESLARNGFKFCAFCGKPVKEQPYIEPKEGEDAN